MVPRLQKRGSSFKGVCAYILHDAGKATAERVDWTATQNLASQPDDAWFEMFETYRDSDELKRRAGRAARGRKNKEPVLHYTLSWHADDHPTADHMRETALSSLKALGLQDHQALLAAHHDKAHLHVHIVVNTVNPDTGLTGDLKYTKLNLSRWAEAYEREHGVHCQERIENNAKRDKHQAARIYDAIDILTNRKMTATDLLIATAKQATKKAYRKRPYVPVKHKQMGRKQWFERKIVVDRMMALRSTLERDLKALRNQAWEKQATARAALEVESEARIEKTRVQVKDKFRPQWRVLYNKQWWENSKAERECSTVRGRIAFVLRNREYLAEVSGSLPWRKMVSLFTSKAAVLKQLGAVHEGRRRDLARYAKDILNLQLKSERTQLANKLSALQYVHKKEQSREADIASASRKGITFDLAKASLVAEQDNAPRPFVRGQQADANIGSIEPSINKAARETEHAQSPDHELRPEFNARAELPSGDVEDQSRAEEIKHGMTEWRKRNQGKDFGREL